MLVEVGDNPQKVYLTNDSLNKTDPFGDMSNSLFEDESENRDKSDENDDKENSRNTDTLIALTQGQNLGLDDQALVLLAREQEIMFEMAKARMDILKRRS